MQRFDRKDVSAILTTIATIAVIPVSLWVTRPRPLEGESVGELVEVVRKSRQNEILEQMERRYEAVSLNFDEPDPEDDPRTRWRALQDSMEAKGVEFEEQQKVIQQAQSALNDCWPCLLERGCVQDQPVWFVAGNVPHDTGFISWICRPSAKDIRDEKIRKYCFNVRVKVISALPPYRALN